jgi:membrane protease YdiL (CAAX protease family)
LNSQWTPDAAEQPESSATPQTSAPRGIFTNERGLRSGWRLLLYAAIVFLLTVASGFVASLFPSLLSTPPGMAALFFQEVAGFAVVFGSAVFMAGLERRPVGVYGLPLREFLGSRFWIGILFGFAEISLLVGAIAACGGYSFGSIALGKSALVQWTFIWAVFFLFVGLFEEFLFRGYTQFTLADGIGFWPAAILLSLAFGAIHWRNPGEGLPGVLSVAATGLFFAFVLRRTGNLWMAVGWHASFDFGETFLFSVPNSGFQFRGHLSSASLHGPAWLTGASSGPEASVFSFLILGLAAFVIHKLYPRATTPAPLP